MMIGIQATDWESSKRYARLAAEFEQAGADYLWIGEAYAGDALTLLGFAAAGTSRMKLGTGIINVYSRSAALIAMSMVGLDQVSGGRAACGLGSSGPPVVEALHGMPYEYPLSRLRGYTSVCRQLWGGSRAEIRDSALQIPLHEGTRPLRLLEQPAGAVPIWWATLKSAGVTATAEEADGWLPFMFFPDRSDQVWGEALHAGLGQRPATLPPLEIAADVLVALGDDYVGDAAEEVLRGHRALLALHIGGMGPRGRNAYFDLAVDYDLEDEAVHVQELFVSGKRQEAAQAVPTELVHGTSLVGPEALVKERLDVYRTAGVTMLNASFAEGDAVSQVQQLRRAVDG